MFSWGVEGEVLCRVLAQTESKQKERKRGGDWNLKAIAAYTILFLKEILSRPQQQNRAGETQSGTSGSELNWEIQKQCHRGIYEG